MEDKMNRIREANKDSVKAFMMAKTDHISVSDFAFVLGTIMKIDNSIKLQEHTVPVLELHEVVISLFMEGKSSKEILEVSNEHAKDLGLSALGVKLMEEWRYSSEHHRQKKQL
jgi:hypothetical protein